MIVDLQAERRWAKLSLWDPSIQLWVSRGAVIVGTRSGVTPINERTRILVNRYLLQCIVPRPLGAAPDHPALRRAEDLVIPRGLQPRLMLTPIPVLLGDVNPDTNQLLELLEDHLEAGYDLDVQFGDELTVAGSVFTLWQRPTGEPFFQFTRNAPTPL
jgi:hypothetical protein